MSVRANDPCINKLGSLSLEFLKSSLIIYLSKRGLVFVLKKLLVVVVGIF
jgi:hypothetical protein